ncbi:hypothetical protein HOK021_34960 [Streptomyces hygroscopicus]|nr:hypothetical protein HOK021_34960 [Streptomyces hygroscopicus]
MLPEAWARLGEDGQGVRARGDAGGGQVVKLGRHRAVRTTAAMHRRRVTTPAGPTAG